jgi:2-polyprenyl-6-hydroxyphenyl methylase/3-demethylubiquinone-9 3-methyltransferase
VDHILEVNTFGHHWRLYSARDIRRYFSLLSKDFRVSRIRYMSPILPKHPLKALALKIIGLLPGFREYLYCEITLGPKKAGLTLEPHW